MLSCSIVTECYYCYVSINCVYMIHVCTSIVLYIYIWLCLFLTRAVFSKGRKFDLCESYPRIIPPKITIMNVSFGSVWDCIGLTSYNGPDKLMDQSWPDPMIPGYLHIPSRIGESSPRAQSLIIIPKLAGCGWLARWLARWLAQLLLLVGWLAIGLASCSWLAAWLAACCVADEADEGDDSGCGSLAGWLATKPKLRRRGT